MLHIVISKRRVAPYATVGIGHCAAAARVENAILCDGRYVMQPRGCRNPRCGIPSEASGDKEMGIGCLRILADEMVWAVGFLEPEL